MVHDDLIRQLRDRQALIVHFSHHANMRDGGVFPADLQAAALNSHLWPLSCCLVWPTHQMSLPGSIGLVLRPCNATSIIGVSGSDGGYSTIAAGQELGGGDPLCQEAFDRSFSVPPGQYNEWRVRDCEVVGIYWETENGELHAKKRVVMRDPDTGAPLSEEIAIAPVSVSYVHECFPDLPAYTRSEGRIIASNVPFSAIYPWNQLRR
jgi:hypothetical protein